jgi:HAD superfamily hydrolase (TIGR01509 family)
VSFADMRPLIGMGGDKLLPAVAGLQEDSKIGRHVSTRRAEIFKQRHLPKLRAFPKTRELVLRMRDAGLRPAIASSAKQEELTSFLELAKVRDLIEGAASANDAENSKPDPDIIQAALVKLGLDPEQVIMIGDTPYDIEAASKAGISTIAFRSGGRSDSDLAGAVAIYDGAADLLLHFTESPLGGNPG